MYQSEWLDDNWFSEEDLDDVTGWAEYTDGSTLVVRCELHPTYTAARKPRADCQACDMLYHLYKEAAKKDAYYNEY